MLDTRLRPHRPIVLNASADLSSLPGPLAHLLHYVATQEVDFSDEFVASIDTAVKQAQDNEAWRFDVFQYNQDYIDRMADDIEKAEERGREEGRVEGREEGYQNLLLKQLTEKVITLEQAKAYGLDMSKLPNSQVVVD